MGVGEATMKTKVCVAVGVSDGIRVGKGVTLGVRVTGMKAAVCVDAASAVCATIKLIAPGRGVGIC